MVKKILVFLSLSLFTWAPAWADDDHHARLPRDATFTTLITTKLPIEGLTGDDHGNLYTTGRGAAPCPVWRISLSDPKLVEVGSVPATCSPSGITFDAKGDLFISDNDKVWTLTPDPDKKPEAKVYATGVLGTNGLAFDRRGDLWTGDGTAGQGRVWRIPAEKPASGDRVGIETFRVQPVLNQVGVGRDVRTVPTGNSQPLVANGIAFNHEGDMLIADTARGAIWKVEMDRHGNVRSRVGCDTTFTEKTLCLNNILVTHPLLEGADGIALDAAGNIWVDANERNAVVVVSRKGEVTELFRNPPDDTTHLRNTGPLETPTSPFLLGHKFCTANSDGGRRDNAPATAGEIGGPGQDKGKISCMDQPLKIPGMRLPI